MRQTVRIRGRAISERWLWAAAGALSVPTYVAALATYLWLLPPVGLIILAALRQ